MQVRLLPGARASIQLDYLIMTSTTSESKPGQRDDASVSAIAATKRLDPDWLRGELGVTDAEGGGILIPYYSEDGAELFRRERGTANCRRAGVRFYQPKG